ncbi:hypothetical protein Tco_0739504 [Tanacetum coccineum]
MKENIVVDGMQRNLIPPGIEGSRGRVIREPESGIFFYNDNFNLVFQREEELHLATTAQLIRLYSAIQRGTLEAEEMFRKLELTIEARDDVNHARKIIKDNLDGLGQNMICGKDVYSGSATRSPTFPYSTPESPTREFESTSHQCSFNRQRSLTTSLTPFNGAKVIDGGKDALKVEKVRALGASGVMIGSRVVWIEAGGGIVRARVVSRVVVLEHPLSLLEFRRISSFDGWKLVHVGNGIKSVVVHGIIFHSLVRSWKSEKHSVGKSHIGTLGYTHHSVGNVVGEVEGFFNGEHKDGTNLFVYVEKIIKPNSRESWTKVGLIIKKGGVDNMTFVDETRYERLVDLSLMSGEASGTVIHRDVVSGIMVIEGLESVSIRRIQCVGYGVLGFLTARIRRIFLDGYDILVVRTVIFKISSFKL